MTPDPATRGQGQTLRPAVETVSNTNPCLLEGAVATAGGNRAVSPRRHSPRYRPLKANTGVRIPLEPPAEERAGDLVEVFRYRAAARGPDEPTLPVAAVEIRKTLAMDDGLAATLARASLALTTRGKTQAGNFARSSATCAGVRQRSFSCRSSRNSFAVASSSSTASAAAASEEPATTGPWLASSTAWCLPA